MQKNDFFVEDQFRNGGTKGSASSRMDCGTISGYLSHITDTHTPTKQYNQKVLQLAHLIPLSGHIGRDKTL